MQFLKSLLICLSLATTFSLNAQTSIGIKGGYTIAWEFYDLPLPDDAEIEVFGVNFGAMVYQRINPNLQIGLEPGFINRGAACEPGWTSNFTGDTSLAINYFELPIMISGHFPFCKGKLELFGKGGYGMGAVLTAFELYTPTGNDEPSDIDQIHFGDDSNFNRWDHGIYSGAGLGLKLGPGQLIVETDFYYGFRNVDRSFTSKNRSLNFNLGYIVQL